MPGHWNTGPTYYDDVLRRWVKHGEWVPYGGMEGAGESLPPTPTAPPADGLSATGAADADHENQTKVAERYTQADGKWRCSGCGTEKDTEKAMKLHLPHCKGKREG